MRKQDPNFEWQIVENDADWERLHASAPPDITADTYRRQHWQRYLWGGAAVLLLTMLGAWIWRTEQRSVHRAAAEATAMAQHEVSAGAQRPDRGVTSAVSNQPDVSWWPQHGRQMSELRTAIEQNAPAAHQEIRASTIAGWGDQAVARVVIYTEHGMAAYRQTRFYRRTDAGWLRMEPDAALWGAERTLETPYFVYHFRQNDAQTVMTIAPQVDTLYTVLWRNVGLPVSPAGVPSTVAGEKPVIEVSVTQPPAYGIPQTSWGERVRVASPAVYLAPAELTDADLLVQTITLSLLEQVLRQAAVHYQIRPAWQPLIRGLRLWQLWAVDLPLSAWHKEVVGWLYLDLPVTHFGRPVILPAHYQELCVIHRLWLPSPVALNIPMNCTALDQGTSFLAAIRGRAPLTRLNQLGIPATSAALKGKTDFDGEMSHPAQTVALATLLEYAVDAYERERLPTLVAGLGQYESWETLLPAVYGVSAAEFEASWQAYLVAHYRLSTEHILP